MDRIEIYWGADIDFEEAIKALEDVNFLVAIFNHICGFVTPRSKFMRML